MKKLLVGVVSVGIAASIALGVRSQLTDKRPVEHLAGSSAVERSTAPAQERADSQTAPPVAAAAPAGTPGNAAAPAGTPGHAAAGTPPKGAGDNRSNSPSVVPPDLPVLHPGSQQSATSAEQEDGGTILRRAAAAYRKVRTMRADFTQVQDNPIVRRRITSRGTVSQQQPDKFLMRFSEPAGDVIVSDGKYFWIYYPSHDPKQVMRLPASVGQGVDLQSQFIGDPTQRFSFTVHGKEEVAGRAASVLTLEPREAAGYRSLKVWIDDKDSLVRRFVLTNDNGVVQHFDLANLQINPTLDPDIFRFTPPAGATVVER